jgi:hypothetical protein
MNMLDNFILRTQKLVMIVFGLTTCATLLFAVDMDLFPMLVKGVDYTEASVPALRHWGIMVFGIGALLVAAAFYPWLRFTTMVYSTIEKGFMIYLYLSNRNALWGAGYQTMFIVDTIICVYSILYFLSKEGRPASWTYLKK